MKDRNKIRKLIAILIVPIAGLILAGCTGADVASNNLSKEADQFKINRRVIFYNGITGEYILTIEGYCSLGNFDPAGELSVICETGPDEYKKHFLGLSDNVTYFAEQLDSADVSKYHYIVLFRPETIIPDIELDIE